MKYRDPHAIALLILRIKELVGCSYHEKLESSHYNEIVTRSNFKISFEGARSYFSRHKPGTNLPRIYFAGTPYLTSFTQLFQPGTWDEFKNSIESVVEDFSSIPPKGLTVEEESQYYEEKIYKKWKNRIEEAIGVSQYNCDVPKVESEIGNKENSELAALTVNGSGTDILDQKRRFFVGEERRRGIENWASYLINPNKPLVITGMAGSGKTNFAEMLVEHPQLVETYGEQRFKIFCEPADTYALFLEKILEKVTASKIDRSNDLETSILTHLSKMPGKKLLLLDNFDTCYDNYFNSARSFLEALQETVTLVYTIRSHFGPRLLEYTLYPLPKLSEIEAIELFNYHSNGKFATKLTDLEYIRYFVGDNAAGYLPLALKLIAKQAETVVQLHDLYKEWQDSRIYVLQIGEDDDDKNWNLIASISLSFNSSRLKDTDRSLLKALCAFPASIIGGRSIIREKVNGGFNMVNRLIGAALIEESMGGQLDIHPMIREYISKQDLKMEPYHEILINHYHNRASVTDKSIGVIGNIYGPLAAEGENIFHSLMQATDREKVNDIICSITSNAFFSGFSEKMAELLINASKSAHAGERIDQEANCLYNLGVLYFLLRRYGQAVNYYSEARKLYRLIPDKKREAHCVMALGNVTMNKKGIDNEPVQYFLEALDLYRENQMLDGEANCLSTLGQIAFNCGQNDHALKFYLDARIVYNQLQYSGREADCVKALGDITYIMGRTDDSLQYFDDALILYERNFNKRGKATCLRSLGDISRGKDDFRVAVRYYIKALWIFRNSGDNKDVQSCLLDLSDIKSLKNVDQDIKELIDRQINTDVEILDIDMFDYWDI